MKRKQTVQEMREATEKALRYQCAMAGKPFPEDMKAPDRKPVKVRAAPVKREVDTSEGSVMTDIAEVYKTHPNILFAVRQTSGAADIGDFHVKFWRWLRRNGQVMTITDTWGVLRDGRFFAIEAKKRTWKGVGIGDGKDAVRERAQLTFINVVKSGGGVGGFVTSAGQAIQILNGCKQPVSFGE